MSCLNREKRPIEIISFLPQADEYGQKKTTQQSVRSIEAVVKPYVNSNVNNPKFNDCELIVLTDDNDITPANSIRIDNKNYDVMYIIESRRLNQILLKLVK